MMTTMELEARKASLAREVLNIDNLDFVKKLERLFKREVKKQEEEISSDPYFKNPENVADILESLEEVKNGECITLRTKEDIHKYLGLTSQQD